MKHHSKLFTAAVITTTFLASSVAMAATVPADKKTLGYSLYDTVVNQMLDGPIGFIGGVALIVVSAINISKNVMLACTGVLGGTAVLKADDIVQTMGAIF